MNKKRVLIFVGVWAAITIVAIIFFFFNRGDDKDNSSLIASDIAAQNIGEIDSLSSDNVSRDIRFFTGSSSATLNLDSKSDDFLKTNLATKDFPINISDEVSGYGNRLLVRSIYSESKDLILNSYLGNGRPVTNDGKAWLMIDGDTISPAFSAEHTNVIDAFVSEKGTFFIRSVNGVSSLYFKDLTGSYSVLKSEITAIKIVGVIDNRVFLGDYFAKVFEYDGNSYKQVLDNTLSLVVDTVSKRIIYKTRNDSVAGEEGGLVESSKENNADSGFIIFDPFSGAKTTYSPPNGQSYVARGYIVTSNSISRPVSLEIYDISSGEVKQVSVDQSATKVSNQIASLVVATKEPLLLAAITNNRQLLIYSNQRTIDKVPEFKLPYISPINGSYVFDQNIGDSSVVVITKKRIDGVVEETKELMKDSCGCDINQIMKSWVFQEKTEGSL